MIVSSRVLSRRSFNQRKRHVSQRTGVQTLRNTPMSAERLWPLGTVSDDMSRRFPDTRLCVVSGDYTSRKNSTQTSLFILFCLFVFYPLRPTLKNDPGSEKWNEIWCIISNLPLRFWFCKETKIRYVRSCCHCCKRWWTPPHADESTRDYFSRTVRLVHKGDWRLWFSSVCVGLIDLL